MRRFHDFLPGIEQPLLKDAQWHQPFVFQASPPSTTTSSSLQPFSKEAAKVGARPNIFRPPIRPLCRDRSKALSCLIWRRSSTFHRDPPACPSRLLRNSPTALAKERTWTFKVILHHPWWWVDVLLHHHNVHKPRLYLDLVCNQEILFLRFAPTISVRSLAFLDFKTRIGAMVQEGVLQRQQMWNALFSRESQLEWNLRPTMFI